jgi:hypothetical protein
MSLLEPLLQSLDKSAEFNQFTDNFIQEKMALIDELVKQEDADALAKLLQEDTNNIDYLQTELNKRLEVILNIKKIEGYYEP